MASSGACDKDKDGYTDAACENLINQALGACYLEHVSIDNMEVDFGYEVGEGDGSALEFLTHLAGTHAVLSDNIKTYLTSYDHWASHPYDSPYTDLGGKSRADTNDFTNQPVPVPVPSPSPSPTPTATPAPVFGGAQPTAPPITLNAVKRSILGSVFSLALIFSSM